MILGEIGSPTANLRAKILRFGGFDASIITPNCKGWSSHVHRNRSGKFESNNLTRNN